MISDAAAGGQAVNGADDNDLEEMRARLADAEEMLRAIRHGEVDALLVVDESGERVYTLRSADAPYRALVEQMQEGAVSVNTSGDIVYANMRFAAFVEVPLERVIGASIDAFVDGDDRETLRGLIAAGAGNLQTRLRSVRRSPFEAHISVSSVRVDGAEHRTLIVTDMSTLNRVQRENRSKDEFLAMLAHELRNPLGAITGAVQVLGLSDLRDHAVRARDVIQRQTLHMSRLVDDLLDVGRVVTGKIALALHAVDLADTVRVAVASQAVGQNVEARFEVTGESVWVNADPVRLEQVVSNLLSNALKYGSPSRPVRVSVQAVGQEAVLEVADEGIGIDADLLPSIFDLFVQGPATIDRTKGGLGIGLTLVHRLVELHGGSVVAASAGKDQGATFTVRLPMARPAVAAALHSPTGAPDARVRVLLVDDNADSRAMYTLILQAEGHEVYEAGDGASALAIFWQVMPDVAVVDIGLPGIDGYEVARQIRSQPAGQSVTLIALTGYGFPEDRERSRQAGFDRHLVKPATPADLRHELAQARRAHAPPRP